MKAIIFHGTDCKPSSFWYSWLKEKLEARGISVDLPHYPQINKGPVDSFASEVIDAHEIDAETILIGHSSGVPLILSLLERINQPIRQAVLVAGFCEPLEVADTPILQENYNWKKIATNANSFLILNSVDDPWGCDDKQGRKLFDKLGGTFLIRNDGHFGSSQDRNYKELPLLEKLIGENL